MLASSNDRFRINYTTRPGPLYPIALPLQAILSLANHGNAKWAETMSVHLEDRNSVPAHRYYYMH